MGDIDNHQRLIRKISFKIMPFVLVISCLSQIDKMTLNYSGVLGIYQDTGISHDQFGMLGSMLYIGQLISQLPSAYIMQLVPMSKFLGVTTFLWGLTQTLMALGNTYSRLSASRILLGVFDASVLPATTMIIKRFHPRSHQAFYIGLLHASIASAIGIGALFTYAMAHITGGGLSPWKWCFIIWGALSVLGGVIIFFLLPDTLDSRYLSLSDTEKDTARQVLDDIQRPTTQPIQWHHIRECLCESRFYCQIIIAILISIPNGMIGNFSSQIIHEMGFSNLDSILLNIPRSAYEMIAYISFAYITRHTRCKHQVAYTIACFLLIPFVGLLLLVIQPIPAGVRLFGVCIAPTIFALSGLQTLINTNVSGTTKMNFYLMTHVAAITVGNYIGPLMMKDPPRYTHAMAGYLAVTGASALLFVYYGWTLNHDNKKRSLLVNELPTEHDEKDTNQVEIEDTTDVENKRFIYRP
ncbi:MFS general substrate transporter [Lichtheimia hyalospora FSU 10163]|nr:MFS general substrate transporter [Lichtheimia hyalospora FSU 10163]